MKKIIILFIICISIGFMSVNYSDNFIDINYKIDIEENTIDFKIKARTNGYVAIGFNPSIAMKNADIIIAAVIDGKVVIEDHFGVSMDTMCQDRCRNEYLLN